MKPSIAFLEKLSGRPAAVVVAVLAAAMYLTWMPHYLTWPWWPDLDAFATIAQGWDQGIKPYRDVVILNFPGQIEVFWLLGRIFGWGRTATMYALDAGLVAILGIVAGFWSLRVFSRSLPGLVGFVAVLSHYASQDFRHVAQRDWQGPELAAIALMVAQGWPHRAGRIISAAPFAMAATIRPHVVLFLPLLVVIGDGSPRRKLRDLAEWGLYFGLGILVWFAPLIGQGLLRDFVRGIRIAGYDRGYNQTSPLGILAAIGREALIKRVAVSLLGNLVALWVAPRALRRLVVPWILGLGIALIYKPLHPRPHLYLDHPLWLFWSLNLGALLAVGFARMENRPWGRLLVLAFALLLAIPGVPKFCDPKAAWQALANRSHPSEPTDLPPGARDFFRPTAATAPYAWEDYRRLLAWLRQPENNDAAVANLFRNPPFPAVNGPTGHVSPWPAESGTIWLWAVDGKLQDDFVAALERSRNCLLIWSPDEHVDDPRCELPGLVLAAKSLFRFEARFGKLEVWRRHPRDRRD